MYIDHRVEPGPPRPGYLERIIDGAVHHGLPQPLDRVPATAGIRRTGRVPQGQLGFRCAAVTFGAARRSRRDASRARCGRRFGFMAIHGGGLEQMTDVIAERAADAAGASVYLRAPSRELPAPPAVGALSRRGVRAARGVPRPRRRRGVAARLRPAWAAAPNCSPAGATAHSPRISREHVAVPGLCTSSPTSTRSPANCAACIPTTRSTACAAVARSSNSRRGCAASARAAAGRRRRAVAVPTSALVQGWSRQPTRWKLPAILATHPAQRRLRIPVVERKRAKRTLDRRHRERRRRADGRLRVVGRATGSRCSRRTPGSAVTPTPITSTGGDGDIVGVDTRLPGAQRPHLPDAVPVVRRTRRRHPGHRHVDVGARRRQRAGVRRRPGHRRAVPVLRRT